ncbi:MAG: stage IV sporulation protein A [Clostridia bacterium]|nr:stage IV sporulation protein A [Clostridia bacterium]
MDSMDIYNDIATRTDGDIYIGVVGPVRTGKSTFIKKFMDLLVIPNIENEFKRERAIDELPQSAQGRTIMTTEPKFIPNEAVEITLDNNAKMNVRLIDCVGFVVPNANGYYEAEMPRMVSTPWFEYEIPFEEAAEIGTKKVITEHSNIGVVVTTDGTVTDLDRGDYEEAEERVIGELKAINKPFIVILNSMYPNADNCISLSKELSEKYNCSVIPVNCNNMCENDVNNIIKAVLYEFPVRVVTVVLPSWVKALKDNHPLKCNLLDTVKKSCDDITNVRESQSMINCILTNENIDSANVDRIELGEGNVYINADVAKDIFYKELSEVSGFDVKDECELMKILAEMGAVKKEYDKISPALQAVNQKGYGVIYPSIDQLTLEEPEIVKQGSRYGVRLKASAPSLHLIRADIETEVSPVVGTEKQSEELVHYLLTDFDDDPSKIWQSNIFGKSLSELVNEGLHNKLSRMPDDAQMKLQETLQRIINEGSGGLICLIL